MGLVIQQYSQHKANNNQILHLGGPSNIILVETKIVTDSSDNIAVIVFDKTALNIPNVLLHDFHQVSSFVHVIHSY